MNLINNFSAAMWMPFINWFKEPGNRLRTTAVPTRCTMDKSSSSASCIPPGRGYHHRSRDHWRSIDCNKHLEQGVRRNASHPSLLHMQSTRAIIPVHPMAQALTHLPKAQHKTMIQALEALVVRAMHGMPRVAEPAGRRASSAFVRFCERWKGYEGMHGHVDDRGQLRLHHLHT